MQLPIHVPHHLKHLLILCLCLISLPSLAQTKFQFQGLSFQHQTIFLPQQAQTSVRKATLYRNPFNWPIENVQISTNDVPIRYQGPRMGFAFGWGTPGESKLSVELGISAHTWRGPTYGREGRSVISSTTEETPIGSLRKDSIRISSQYLKPHIANLLGLDATIRWRFNINKIWHATLGAKIAFASAQDGIIMEDENQSTFTQYYIDGEPYSPRNTSPIHYTFPSHRLSGKGISPYFFRATVPLQVDATVWQNEEQAASVGLFMSSEVGLEKWGFIPAPYLIWALSAGFRYYW